MRHFKEYINERQTRDEFKELLIKKFKSKKITVLPTKSYHQNSMIYIKIDVQAIKEKQFYLIDIKDDELVSGPSSDSVNYQGNWFDTESEVIKDIEKWYKTHERQIKEFSKLEKIYSKLGNNLEIGESSGIAAVIPTKETCTITSKEAEILSKKLKLDYNTEKFNGDIEKHHFGKKDDLDGWGEINSYNSEFSIQVWRKPRGKLRDVTSSKVDSWDKPTAMFKKAITEIDKL